MLNPICVIDRERKVLFANEYFLSFFGQSPRITRQGRTLDSLLETAGGQPFSFELDSEKYHRYHQVELISGEGVATGLQFCLVPLVEAGASVEVQNKAEQFAVFFHDVSVEMRLHEKYRHQLAENEKLIGRLKQKVRETLTLRSFGEIDTNRNTLSQTLESAAEICKMVLGWRDVIHIAQPATLNSLVGAFAQIRLDSRLRAELASLEARGLRMDRNSFFFFGQWVALRISPRLGPNVWIVIDHRFENEEEREFIIEFRSRVAALIETQQTAHAAMTDGLTGLFNRRYFDSTVAIECSKSVDLGTSLSLLVMDVDNFKQINDRFGHPGGDDILRQLGGIIREVVRKSNIVARVGGDEFAAVLPNTDANDAQILAERIRAGVAKHQFKVRSNEGDVDVPVTVSIGISGFLGSHDEMHALYERADKALYAAKMSGRNATRGSTPGTGTTSGTGHGTGGSSAA